MDYLHYLLTFAIVVIIMLNNISICKKYYIPFFFFLQKKYLNLSKIKKIINKESVCEKHYKDEETKKSILYKNFNNEKIKIIQNKLSWNYQVAVMNLNSNLNIGAIYRTGCLLGMEKYIIIGKKIYNPRSQVGLDFVEIEYLDAFTKIRDRYDKSTVEDFNLKVFISYINFNKLTPILIEQGGINILKIDFKKFEDTNKYLFIFGNETHGIPTNLIKLAKDKNWLILSIPQWGCAHSFNVSQASNIVMWKYYYDNIITSLKFH